VKVLGIMGSSRRDGNTNDLLEVALKGAAEAGVEVENSFWLTTALTTSPIAKSAANGESASTKMTCQP
jgi:Multimeric flavodoxin WrbA